MCSHDCLSPTATVYQSRWEPRGPGQASFSTHPAASRLVNLPGDRLSPSASPVSSPVAAQGRFEPEQPPMSQLEKQRPQEGRCVCVCVCVCLVAQLCPTLCNLMGCSPPDSSVHGILPARILELVAMPSSRRSSQSRDGTQVSHIASGFFTI